MKTKYVIAVKRIRDYFNEPTEKWEYAQFDNYSGSFSTGYPVFGSECHATTFDSVELAEDWLKRFTKDIRFNNDYDLLTLNVYERTYKEVESKINVLMNRKDLLCKLKAKYSFEKAHSIIHIATEDREYEDDNVKIVMTRTLMSDVYILEWKKGDKK